MSNSRARCSGCKLYFPRDELQKQGLSGVCGDDCKKLLLEKHRIKTERKVVAKAAAKVARKKKYGTTADPRLKAYIRRRDGNVCRYCERPAFRLEVHHVAYRSQGGPDHASNLITLCDEHHRLVHSDKRRWQPVLRAVIWLYYVEGKRLTVPETECRVKRAGLLAEPSSDVIQEAAA